MRTCIHVCVRGWEGGGGGIIMWYADMYTYMCEGLGVWGEGVEYGCGCVLSLCLCQCECVCICHSRDRRTGDGSSLLP